MTGLADVDRFKIFIQVCMQPSFRPLIKTSDDVHTALTKNPKSRPILVSLLCESLFGVTVVFP